MRHLQLNTSTLNHPKEIVDFLVDKDIDIACFQEICYPIDGENPLLHLLPKEYTYVEGIHFYYEPTNQIIGTGIVSKYPILDVHRYYYNSPELEPKRISENNIVHIDMAQIHPGSRGIKQSIKSRCIIEALIDSPIGIIRVITTHFTVSDHCSETHQMLDMARIIRSLVKHASPIPTIFSGDLNIRPQSYSVDMISEVMTCHTKNFTDTLSASHVAKEKDFPEGLAVDHVFSLGFKIAEVKTEQVEFSEHKALITDFS